MGIACKEAIATQPGARPMNGATCAGKCSVCKPKLHYIAA